MNRTVCALVLLLTVAGVAAAEPQATPPAAPAEATPAQPTDLAARIKALQEQIAAMEARLAELRQTLAKAEADLKAAGGDPAAAMLGVVKPDDPKADNQEPKPVLLSDIIAAGWKSVKAAPEPSKESNEERLYRQEQESTPWVGKRLIMKGRITSAGSDPRNPDDYGIHVVYEGSRQVDIDASPYRKNRVPAERVGVGLRGLDRSVLGLEHGTPAKLDIVIRSVRFTGQYDRKTLHVTIIAESGSWE